MNRELADDQYPDTNVSVSVTEESQTRRLISVQVPEESVAEERERIVKELRRDLKVPGFRQGKIPVEYIRKNYAEVIQSDAVRNLLPMAYEQAVIREGLHPLGDPTFDKLSAEPGAGLSFEARVEVRPEVEVTGYDHVEVEIEKREVGDEQVNAMLADLRERLATFEPVAREASTSDFVAIDYAPYLESGEIDEKALQKNYPVDLSGDAVIEDFRIGLVGMKQGEEKDLEVKYPDDFSDKELAGKTKRFHVTAVEVKEKLLPELNDAFAKRLNSDVETLLELKVRIREDLEKEEEHRQQHEIEEKVIDALIEKNPFEVPEVMIENYLSSVIEEDRRRRPQVPDEEARVREIRELFRDAAVRSIRKYFIMDAVRRQENLAVGQDEIDARVASLVESSGRTPEEIRGYLADPERRRSFESDLLDKKIMDLLRARATVREA